MRLPKMISRSSRVYMFLEAVQLVCLAVSVIKDASICVRLCVLPVLQDDEEDFD